MLLTDWMEFFLHGNLPDSQRKTAVPLKGSKDGKIKTKSNAAFKMKIYIYKCLINVSFVLHVGVLYILVASNICAVLFVSLLFCVTEKNTRTHTHQKIEDIANVMCPFQSNIKV